MTSRSLQTGIASHNPAIFKNSPKRAFFVRFLRFSLSVLLSSVSFLHSPFLILRNPVMPKFRAKLLIARPETSRDFGCIEIKNQSCSTRRHFVWVHFSPRSLSEAEVKRDEKRHPPLTQSARLNRVRPKFDHNGGPEANTKPQGSGVSHENQPYPSVVEHKHNAPEQTL